MSSPGGLPAQWRERAESLRAYAPPAAVAWERAADELEAALLEAADEELDLQTAATESGYSPRRLRELIADGTIPNAGRKGAPRIRRADLPRRAGSPPGSYDPVADAADLAGRIGRRT